MPLVIEQMVALSPDVIGLQEVDLTIDQGISLCRLVNSRIADQPHYRAYHMTRPGRAAHLQGLAVMTRLDVEAHEGMDYLTFESVAQRLRLRLAGGELLDFYNTHLHFPPEATAERLAQAEKLLAWTETWSGANATVVVGDFNAYVGEPTVDLMKSRFVSAHEAVHGREPEKTWPTPVNTYDKSPPGCLDYVYVAGADVLEAGLCFDKPHPLDADLFPSDHLGVMARLRIGGD
jgi:endonuclease/exonuclease/phosphatase family metal-dependent hydrolase